MQCASRRSELRCNLGSGARVGGRAGARGAFEGLHSFIQAVGVEGVAAAAIRVVGRGGVA